MQHRAAKGMVPALQGRASGTVLLLSRNAARAAGLRRAPQCPAQRLARRQASSGRAAASRAPARTHDSAATVSRRVEARSSALSSVDASDSFDGDESTVPPRFLVWCRSAQAETRAINYILNGSMIALVLTASATELLELTRGDFFSAHASLEGVRMALNQSWEAYARAVDAHPLATKVPWPWDHVCHFFDKLSHCAWLSPGRAVSMPEDFLALKRSSKHNLFCPDLLVCCSAYAYLFPLQEPVASMATGPAIGGLS